MTLADDLVTRHRWQARVAALEATRALYAGERRYRESSRAFDRVIRMLLGGRLARCIWVWDAAARVEVLVLTQEARA